MNIVRLTKANYSEIVQTAVQHLAAGDLIIFPTETTYGAGVDATNPAAVAKLLKYKARREGKPLSIAVTDQTMAEQFVVVNDDAKKLYQRFLPGPVTVVSQDKGLLADGVASEFGTIGVRIPDYQLVIDIVQKLGRPITATSANASDAKRPYSLEDIWPGLSEKQKSLIDLAIDAGTLPKNPPSTVIDTTSSTPIIFRQGSITIESDKIWQSDSESETQALAGKLLLKWWNQVQKTGVVIALNGSLGVGKTVFTKGIAQFLGITDTITSPTYTYLEEYSFQRHQTQGMMYHLDLWKVDSAEALKRLEIESLLKPNTITIIEWFNQVEPWLAPLVATSAVPLLRISISETHPGRQLIVEEPDEK